MSRPPRMLEVNVFHHITVRCNNREFNFWEGRYRSTSFPGHEQQRALNTLRYIHANPKAAGMRKGYFYAYSNYGTYDRLTDDGLTEWHPAFLSMGQSLDTCQKRYQRFCQRYSPKKKARRVCAWGSRWFPLGLLTNSRRVFPGQTDLFVEKGCQVTNPGQAHFRPEFARRAAVFTTANG